MIGLMLQVAGGFSDLLSQLEGLGFFQYILPFLLIFAVVYAILTKISVFEKNKGAGVIVALAIGLLSLQFDKVPAFFQNIFPKFGIGLAILLVGLILAGAFISSEEKKTYSWIFFGLGALIFLIVTFTSLSDWQFTGSYWWDRYATLIIVIMVVAGLMLWAILGQKENKEK